MPMPIVEDLTIAERYVDTIIDVTMRANGSASVTGGVFRQIRRETGQAKPEPCIAVSARLILSFEAAQELASLLQQMIEKLGAERARPN